uniref:Uncharacterized protein n=1 Tax=Glossina brevipalpis TaxID=37001 RepID=A0A1A9WYB5_9MUSC
MFKSRSFHDVSIKLDDASGGNSGIDKNNGSGLQKSHTICVVERNRGFKPSDRHDPAKKKFLLDLSKKIWQKNEETVNLPGKINLNKLFTPAEDAKEILPRNRKLYASSAFYSPLLHPTVEDQVELARRISHSLSDISNQKSKGQSMYCNRKKRSVKWVHESSEQEGKAITLEAENCNRESKENGSTYPRDSKLPLRLLMNPLGRMRDFNSVHDAFNTEAGLLSPNNCAELVTALHNYKDKGAELFAKRRKVADKWVVDETNVGTQRPVDLLDFHEHQQQSRQSSSPSMLPAETDVQLNVEHKQLLDKTSLNAVKKSDKPTSTSGSPLLKEETHIGDISNLTAITNLSSPKHQESPPTAKEEFRTLSEIDLQITHEVTSHSSNSDFQRDLAYKPSIPQGWKAPCVILPKSLYVPKKISLQSYAPPPISSGCGNRVQTTSPKINHQTDNKLQNSIVYPQQLQGQKSATDSTFVVKTSQPAIFASECSGHISPPKANQHYQAPNRYKMLTKETNQNTPQVNFSPSPLSYDKLAKFEHNQFEINGVYSAKGFPQTEQKILNILSPDAIVSPKPLSPSYGILHDGNPRYLNTNVGQNNSRCNDNRLLYAPTYNNSARGWYNYNVSKNFLSDQDHSSVITTQPEAFNNMPYTDF